MHAVRRKKLSLLIFVVCVLSLVVALVLYALRQNISLFYTPTQVRLGQAPLHALVHVGGMVKKGSLVRAAQGLEVKFVITDFKHTVHVVYNGILPDLFREGQGVVVEGVVQDKHVVKAKQVLAKHDANYMPPHVQATLRQTV